MSDIEKSFTFLRDNVPSWLSNLADIGDKIAHMQNEMAKAPVSTVRLKRKTGSIESIRDLDVTREDLNTSVAAQTCTYTTTRKRKSPSILSAHPSGPPKFRSRTMILVYYDGQIQKSFEALVRNIGIGRNMLRKGKMAAKMEALASLAGSQDDSGSEDGDDPVMAKISFRHRNGLSSMRARMPTRSHSEEHTSSTSSSQELFDSTDKALELAQGLCERAAHQSLRDGDCRKELDGMTKHFQDVLDTAAKEVSKYAARKELEASTREPEVVSTAVTPAIAPKHIEPKPVLATIKTAPPAIPATSTAGAGIEVDDDEDDDFEFVMPPIRLTSRV